MDETKARQDIADHLGVPVSLVVDDAAFRQLGADSLDLIELTLFLEQEFDVFIPEEDAFSCTQVGDALRVLRQALTNRDGRLSAAAPVSQSGR